MLFNCNQEEEDKKSLKNELIVSDGMHEKWFLSRDWKRVMVCGGFVGEILHTW